MIKLNDIRLIAMNIVKQVAKPLETVALFIREPLWVKIKKVTCFFIMNLFYKKLFVLSRWQFGRIDAPYPALT